ncbi:MAG: GUN4 domain-containing protein [Cyanobacteria bacterium P01_D01_bin.6]
MITADIKDGLQELESLLSHADWQMADEVTFQIMLATANRRDEGWLDQAAIAVFPCEILHHLDQSWLFYSSGRFGFSTQLDIYREAVDRSTFDFSRQNGWIWTMNIWRPIGFFNFYSWLIFSIDAPRGHLPALWFWEMPWYRSWLTGGFGTGRGGGFGEPSLFDALMLRLERCQLI